MSAGFGLLMVASAAVGIHGFGVGVVMGSWPTVFAALGFAFAGLVAVSFPLHLPWLPLAAPLGVLAIYALAARPFLS